MTQNLSSRLSIRHGIYCSPPVIAVMASSLGMPSPSWNRSYRATCSALTAPIATNFSHAAARPEVRTGVLVAVQLGGLSLGSAHPEMALITWIAAVLR